MKNKHKINDQNSIDAREEALRFSTLTNSICADIFVRRR